MTQAEYEHHIIALFQEGRASPLAWEQLGRAVLELYGTDLEATVAQILAEAGEWVQNS